MLNISYNLKHLYQYRGYCGQETDIDQLALGQRGSLTVEEREKTSQALNNLYFLCQNFSFIIL